MRKHTAERSGCLAPTGVGFACCMWVFGDTFEFRQSATPSFCDLDHKKRI
jgi:hypothetical protein